MFADVNAPGASYGTLNPEKAQHHVGVRTTKSIPFNVVHLDGHVCLHQYDPTASGAVSWHYGRSQDMPYGNTVHRRTHAGFPGKQKTGYDTDIDRLRR
jgi:hypothetical protein